MNHSSRYQPDPPTNVEHEAFDHLWLGRKPEWGSPARTDVCFVSHDETEACRQALYIYVDALVRDATRNALSTMEVALSAMNWRVAAWIPSDWRVGLNSDQVFYLERVIAEEAVHQRPIVLHLGLWFMQPGDPDYSSIDNMIAAFVGLVARGDD